MFGCELITLSGEKTNVWFCDVGIAGIVVYPGKGPVVKNIMLENQSSLNSSTYQGGSSKALLAIYGTSFVLFIFFYAKCTNCLRLVIFRLI